MLTVLENIFIWADARQRDIKMLSDALARERWTLREARKLIPKEAWDRLMIEREVNRMDPDFQFASGEDVITRPHSLVYHLSETER